MTPLEREIENIQALTQTPLILDVCSRATGMRFTAVAHVTGERWITCASRDHLGFGLKPGDELEVETTICHEVRACRDVIVIDDVEADEVWRAHDTPKRYGFRSYISTPIIRGDGSFFGTLCAIDPEPRTLNTPETLGMFRLFADLIAAALDNRDEAVRSKRQLVGERETARLREEFIAVVGHDLRNPLAALSAGIGLLERSAPEAPRELLARMKQSIFRMSAILDNLLDLARGRLGDGMAVEMEEGIDLARVIEGVAGELRSATEQPIELRLDLDGPVRCDAQRIGQLVSNLLGNAVSHGAADTPVVLEARTDAGRFSLSVSNEGEPIPDEVMPSLFLPFSRGGGDRPSRQGLGLGLYIASEIAKAHGGELSARSTPEKTTFLFTMPQGRAAGRRERR